jgi:hypothetical protein
VVCEAMSELGGIMKSSGSVNTADDQVITSLSKGESLSSY